MVEEKIVAPDKDNANGGYIRTYTGGMFNYLKPHPDQVNPVDIAHALALTCRYNGHIPMHYSVAQHCVEVHNLLVQETGDLELAYAGLCHDAAEAYTGDMVNPLKQLMPEFKRLEKVLDAVVGEALGARIDPLPPEVKMADTTLFIWERRDLHGWPVMVPGGYPVPKRRLRAWSARKAEQEWLSLYNFHQRGEAR